MFTTRLLVEPIPAERLDEHGAWVPTRVKAWVRRGGTWSAWVETPAGVRLAEYPGQVRPIANP